MVGVQTVSLCVPMCVILIGLVCSLGLPYTLSSLVVCPSLRFCLVFLNKSSCCGCRARFPLLWLNLF
jgi:hypothetical protein